MATGNVPAALFDTQIAAGFCGLGLPSLSELHERQLGTLLPKGDRLTDWLRRPLSDDQLRYAAADVADLPQLHERLATQLAERARTAWAQAECELLRARVRTLRDPDEAWTRIREVRQLRGRNLAVAREVAAWRERRAAARRPADPPRAARHGRGRHRPAGAGERGASCARSGASRSASCAVARRRACSTPCGGALEAPVPVAPSRPAAPTCPGSCGRRSTC